MRRSMRMRMTVAFVAFIALFTALGVGSFFMSSLHSAETGDANYLRGLAGRVAERVGEPGWQAQLTTAVGDQSLFETDSAYLVTLIVEGPDGEIVWSSAGTGIKLDRGWRVETAKAGKYTVIAARLWDRSSIHGAHDRLVHVLGVFELLVLPLVAVGAWFLVGRTLRPIQILAHQTSQASAENLQTRLVAPSDDKEIVELVSTLNGLLDRISETVEAKGRFYSAASHELRTPLQALSGHLETALSRDRDADDYRSALAEAQSQASRLTVLVRDLLLLHQFENKTSAASEVVDALAIVGATMRDLQPLVEARSLGLDFQLPPTLSTRGTQTHADILVRNLLENAVRYATPSTTITARADAHTFTLTNQCDLEATLDPETLFEPFRRPDVARNQKTGGNGLGLAICRAAAAANGWTIELRRVPEGLQAKIDFTAPDKSTR